MTKTNRPHVRDLISSPMWHLHEFKAVSRKLSFLSLSENDYRQSIFLDGRFMPKKMARAKSEFRTTARLFASAARPPGKMSYIFHIGHCGSTLLSNALAGSKTVLPLREPQILKTLSSTLSELNDPVSLLSDRDWERFRDIVLFALSRTFHEGQHPLVKATSTCNNLVIPLMETAFEAKAVLLFQPLDSFLAGFFKPGNDGRDLMIQARDRMLQWLSIPGAPRLRIIDLKREQLAVVSWLTSMYYLLEAHARLPKRTMVVNFDDFLGDSAQHLVAINSFLGIQQDVQTLLGHYDRISTQYSKRPSAAFTSQDRQYSFVLAREKHGEEIQRGVQWAGELVQATPALKPTRQWFD